jgi:hypothetical protein
MNFGLGTDRGVYVTQLWKYAAGSGAMSLDTTGVKWSLFGTGLPNTLISDLVISPSRMMTAATYGRGVYQLQLP